MKEEGIKPSCMSYVSCFLLFTQPNSPCIGRRSNTSKKEMRLTQWSLSIYSFVSHPDKLITLSSATIGHIFRC